VETHPLAADVEPHGVPFDREDGAFGLSSPDAGAAADGEAGRTLEGRARRFFEHGFGGLGLPRGLVEEARCRRLRELPRVLPQPRELLGALVRQTLAGPLEARASLFEQLRTVASERLALGGEALGLLRRAAARARRLFFETPQPLERALGLGLRMIPSPPRLAEQLPRPREHRFGNAALARDREGVAASGAPVASSNSIAAQTASGRDAASDFTAERCVVTIARPPFARKASSHATASALPSSGSVAPPTSSRSARASGCAASRMRARIST